MSKISWTKRVSRAKLSTSLSPDQCKTDIIRLNCAIKAKIQDIWECKGPLIALNNLNKEALEILNNLKLKIEQLEELASELDHERLRLDLIQFAENQSKQVQFTQSTLRKANVSCKRAIDNREKDSLLGARETRLQQIRLRNSNTSKLELAQNVEDNLLNITRRMDNTLQQSTEAMHTLISSSTTVNKTGKEIQDQRGLIQTSHRLITKYNRREFTDKILIILALALFFSTVLYILKRRLF